MFRDGKQKYYSQLKQGIRVIVINQQIVTNVDPCRTYLVVTMWISNPQYTQQGI